LTVFVRVLQIIAIVVIAFAILLFIILLPLLSRLLKKLNKSLSAGRPAIAREMSTSLGEMKAAQDQIESVAVYTDSVESGMKAAISAADRAVGFLESNAFQVGLPALIWVLFLTISIFRVLKPRNVKKKVTVIPPPSWESESE